MDVPRIYGGVTGWKLQLTRDHEGWFYRPIDPEGIVYAQHYVLDGKDGPDASHQVAVERGRALVESLTKPSKYDNGHVELLNL